MKKYLAALLVLMVLLCGVLPAVYADSIKDDSAALGVDMVIVLDMTNSMRNPYDANKGNDVYNYRLDATAMLIGMLDMDQSRVAIVPFAGSPMNEIPLQPINDQESRDKLLKSIYNMQVKPKTNIGAALMKANEILYSREDKTNLPAIILMTDGNNEMKGDDGPTGDVAHSLRWVNGEIIDKGQEAYSTATAIQVTREAVDCASTLGYPIYTVALNQDPDVSPDNGISLRAISQGTGQLNGCWFVSKDNAKELPAFFAKILADKIGSSVQNKANPEPVEGKANTYQVKIPVLNKSVLETNIIIPVKSSKGTISTIDPKSIQIIDSEGILQSEYTGVSILYEKDLGHFALVKIREPRATGMWTLQFTSEKDPGDVTFNILYHYDIQLSATVTMAGQEQQEFYKNDLITIRSNFVDGQGNASMDEALYQDNSENPDYEEWMKMKVAWDLYQYNENGILSSEPVRTGTMTPDLFRYVYDGQIDLREDTVLSGNYQLIIRADGAGLYRKVMIPIVLKNHDPEGSDFVHSINVNSTVAGDDASWTVEGTSGTLPKKATEIITDKDHDSLMFNLRAEEGVEQSATMELNQEDGTISFTTKAAGNMIQDGQAVYRLYYDDGDSGKGNVLITLNIKSDVAAMLAKYEPVMTVSGTSAGGANEYKKDSDLTVTVRLKEREGAGYADGELVGFLGRTLAITDTKADEVVVSAAGMDLNGDALEYTINTGNKSAEWLISVKIDHFDEPVTASVTIPNKTAPAITAQEDKLTLNCDGEKVPSFLSGIIGVDTAEDDPSRDICTTVLFKDEDGEKPIVSDPVFLDPATGEQMDLGMISATAVETNEGSEEKHYLINYDGQSTGIFSFSFTSRMTVTAEDGDGEKTTYTREVVVVNLFNKMLTYLAIALIAIVIIVIICLIVHQIRKPVFPKVKTTIREDTSIYESDGAELYSYGKKTTNMNSAGVDAELADKHSISLEMLQQMIICPVRLGAAVGITIKKMAPDHEVILSDQEMKPKKKYIWRTDEEIIIRNKKGEGMVTVILKEMTDDIDVDAASDFGSDDEWSTASETPATTSSGRKHSRKVQRTKPAEEDTSSTSTGSSDDFDF